MQPPATPPDEPKRLEALRALNILDTPPEPRYDRITRLAQRFFQVPIVLVSLVDADRQWFKSRQGLAAAETPRNISFCGHAILADDLLVVPDTLEDERFCDNPLVCGNPDIRFYAGAPLHDPAGLRLGTLCLIDRQPRKFSPEDRQTLRDLADGVEAELERSSLLHRASRERSLAMVVQHTTLGVTVADALGRVEWVNPGFERISGYTLAEVRGHKPGTLLQGPDTDPRTVAFMGQCRRDGRPFQVEVLNYHKDGHAYWSDLHVQPVRDDQGALTNFIAIKNDITERKRLEERAKGAEQQYKAVVESVLDGIITIDERGTVLTANAAAIQTFGYSQEELVGRNVKLLMPEPYHSEHDGYLDHYLHTGQRRIIGIGREVVGLRKNGEKFPMELAVSELSLDGRRIFTGLTRDITERKRLEQLKTEFVSTVSHELRTPLTAIRGALALVLKKEAATLPDRSRHMLEMAERNSERLTFLINDILDLEKIEGGKLAFDFAMVDLAALAVRAIEDNEGYARKHEVNLMLDAGVPSAPVKADAQRMLQVFANLISNAVKFSPAEGTVEVRIEALQGTFRVSVRDHGAGIPDHFRDRIFQRFAQADSSDAREKGGTGLGLSITKAIVEHHRGHIGFTSTPGEGTTFFFDLPGLVEIQENSHPAGPRVLICEDDPDWAQVLQQMVQVEGCSADIAATGKAARELIARHDYALLLLDLTLPDENGLDLLADLRSHPETQDLRVMVVSGRAREGQPSQPGNSLSVADWLQKPVDQARLSRALQTVFGSAGRPRVLHVEDDPDLIFLIHSLLGDAVDYHSAGTLKEGKERLAAQRWDLLLLDLGLPDGSGMDLLSQVPAGCRVVIFSADAPSRQTSTQVIASLTKSVTDNDQLLATLRVALHQGRPKP